MTTHDRGSTPTTTTTTTTTTAPLDATDAAARIAAIVDEVERAVVGKRDRIELVLAALLAGGHVLLDDVPGVAKTLMARSIASATGLTFSRVQFTPDVLPSDITGATVLDLTTRAPVFRAGPLFAQIVLADEINRAPAKTQAALLEAMQEAQVTADGVSHPLPDPFWVIATENPVESEGTYPLPEAQLDRFLVRTTIGYPTHDGEVEVVARRLTRTSERIDLDAVSSALDLAQVRATIEAVHVDPSVIDHAVRITTASRRHRDLSLGVSPRGTVALVTLARSHAVVQGRDFVTPDDVRRVALPALAHRVALSDEAWARGLRNDDVMRSVVDSVAAPSWE